MGDHNIILLQEAEGWPDDVIVRGWRLVHQSSCPAAILISPTLKDSIRWTCAKTRCLATMVHDVLFLSCYFPDSTYPLEEYLEAFDEMKAIIFEARNLGFRELHLG
eukprot:12109935-Karenia_brevis.AAC.1